MAGRQSTAGPHRRQGLIAAFMHRIARGQPVEIWGDGQVVRDFIYIDDVIEAILAAAPDKPAISAIVKGATANGAPSEPQGTLAERIRALQSHASRARRAE